LSCFKGFRSDNYICEAGVLTRLALKTLSLLFDRAFGVADVE